jgi:hypothetical protein
MADLTETGLWAPGVYQLEIENGPQGGSDGIDNVPLRQLADRAKFLNDARLSGYIAGKGRNLLTVLGVTTIAQAMTALRALCNGTGTPDFSKLQTGDYLDGIDLSGIAASAVNTAGQAWNGTYRNNRIVIAAFNPYKGVGDTEVTKNHILFAFANVPLRARMNPSNSNTGGYTASEMRVFLDGLNGDGSGDFVCAGQAPENPVVAGAFLAALTAQIGDYIMPVRKLLDESIFEGTQTWAWRTYRLFLHSENDVFGANAWGRAGYGDGQKLHIRLYRDSYAYRIKRYNGSRDWWWLNTPHAGSAADFCIAISNGFAHDKSASAVGGCAPDSVRCNTVGRLRPIHPTQKEKTSCCKAGRLYTNIRLDTSGRTLRNLRFLNAWRADCVKPVSCPVMLRGILRKAPGKWQPCRKCPRVCRTRLF